MITSKTKLCMIIGDPVEHSLSPQMHNSCYSALGIDGEFVFVASHVKKEDVELVAKAARALGVRGLTCTIPHKVEIMKHLDFVDEVAKKIGAVNSVVNDNGVLKGYNTDWLGVYKPLQKEIDLKGKSVALLGAGGAARAFAYAVLKGGANLKVYNRYLEGTEEFSKNFEVEVRSFEDLSEVADADIIANATPITMEEGKTPISKEYLSKGQVVFDAVYTPLETQLLKDAKEKGAKVIHGTEMLLYQGLEQFKLYTEKEAPEEVMRKVIEDET